MATSRPLPDTADPLTAPFWDGANQDQLLIQACDRCGYLRWPPGPMCPECQDPNATWTPVRPSGTVWSTATYRRALDPAFADDVPYTVGLIELDDGPRMYGRLHVEPGADVIGRAVRATFRAAAPGINLVEWELAEQAQPTTAA
jgi:uncharacterized OB-fold protein